VILPPLVFPSMNVIVLSAAKKTLADIFEFSLDLILKKLTMLKFSQQGISNLLRFYGKFVQGFPLAKNISIKPILLKQAY
jgi:hypothetical protein